MRASGKASVAYRPPCLPYERARRQARRPLPSAGILIGFLCLTVAAGGCQHGDDVPTFVVRKQTLSRHVTAEGTIEAEKATPVTAPMEAQGPMKIGWIADDQTLVRKGDVLVRFDPTDFENNRRLGVTDQEKAMNRFVKLSAESGATSRNLERDSTQADRELANAEQSHLEDPDIYSRYQRAESQIDRGLALEKKQYAQNVMSIRQRLSGADRDLISIDRHKADLKVGQADKALRALVVTAPYDGIFVLKKDWKGEVQAVGSTVWSGTPIAEIPQLGAMKAEVFVVEADAGGISAGQKAVVTLESLPARRFAATVSRVDKVAKPRYRGVPVQYFGITLGLASRESAITKPGARVHATIELADEKQVTVVPRQAVFDRNGKHSVWVRRPGGFAMVQVDLGSSSAGQVIITKGVHAGDVIALQDPKAGQGAGRDASTTGGGS